MLWLVISIVLLLVALILFTRDNIFASLLLTGLGVAVAVGSALYLGPLAFILVTLVYIVASLTLVVIAAATLGDVKETRKFKWAAAMGLALLFTPLLAAPTEEVTAANTYNFDFWVVPILAAFIIYILKVAVEVSI